MTIADALSGVRRLGIDSAPIIYFVEEHPTYDACLLQIFQQIANGSITGITSVVSLCEVLVQPVKKGDTRLQQSYREVMEGSAHFEVLALESRHAEKAAELRARYGLRTPDALQIATAILSGCEAFLTNDTNLKRVQTLRILVLDEIVG
jgi:predicted nucleic acid-binding protein